MSGRYLIRTYGCQMNEHDSERIAGLLEADGYEQAEGTDDADVIVLNTCCVRENADNKLYGALGHLKALKAKRPDLQIVVGGCLAQKDRDRVMQRAGHVDVVFGTHNVHRAVELLHHAREHGPIVEILEAAVRDDTAAFPSALNVRRELGHAAWVTIQVGCDNTCAFCIVPAVRGEEISRPFAELVAEVEGLAAQGVVEVTLLGQNVNSYGRDLTKRRPLFADLLRAVGAVPGIRRVRYTSPHPKDLRTETIAAMAETAAVCEHLHLPLQSGSDRILSAMHRGYRAERYLEKLAAARAAIPGLAVTTDIIVGFPGETDDDFARTLEVAAEAQYDSAFTFVFSPREGTEAAAMTDRFVPHDVCVDRFEQLRVVIERSARAKNAARVGVVEDVIVEGPSKRDPAVLTGRTRQNKLVHFASPSLPAAGLAGSPPPLRAGSFVDVRVTEGASHYLHGELVAVTAAPRHRTRIPVATS
jgi:tRNA-2-methylthio-N6-dimethylallyladenosine synthase